MLNVEIPNNIEKVLTQISLEMKKPTHEIVLDALREYLEDIEDYKAGVRGYHEYLESGKKGVSLTQLQSELDL